MVGKKVVVDMGLVEAEVVLVENKGGNTVKAMVEVMETKVVLMVVGVVRK